MSIEFWLDDPNPSAELCYLPYGTRSVRVTVKTKAQSMPSVIQPEAFLQADQDAGLFCGYEDGVTSRAEADFELSWGGGQEQGPPTNAEDVMGAFERAIPLEAGMERVLIFNLTHIGRNIPDQAQLTLVAIDVETGEKRSYLTITLTKPQSFQPDIARMVMAPDGSWQVQPGAQLPVYEGRWWPESQVKYTAAPSNIPLTVQPNETKGQLNIYWNGTHIAKIDDKTDPPVLREGIIRAEIYDFDRDYIALRVWFFWLNINIGHGFFIGRHEVPDSERFDFLILAKDGSVPLACTDLHWRESWGQGSELPIRATIGLARETKIALAKEGLGKLWDRVWGKPKKENDRAYNPLPMVRKLAMRHANGRGAIVNRAKGTEAHVPMIHNMDMSMETLTSSDVRLG